MVRHTGSTPSGLEYKVSRLYRSRQGTGHSCDHARAFVASNMRAWAVWGFTNEQRYMAGRGVSRKLKEEVEGGGV